MINKKRIGDNINALAKWYGLKIGDVEKSAGISQGYISRLSKSNSEDTNPVIDLLITASELFRIPIDSLVSLDFGKIANPEKRRLQGFFETLLYLSNRDQIKWERSIESNICKEEYTAGFICKYKPEISFYVFQLENVEESDFGYSFYIRNKEELTHVAQVNLPGSVIYDSMRELFQIATLGSEFVNINQSADYAIRCFMSENNLILDPSEEQKKYRPLYVHLSQRSEKDIFMTFYEVQEILGFNLPTSAWKYHAFWANNENGQHHHCKSWIDAGYKTVDVPRNTIEHQVHFKRFK